MKALFWFIFGMLVAIGGQAFAQYFDSYDNQGNELSGYTDQFGNTMWQDSQGLNGYQYSIPAAPMPFIPRNPC